MVWPRSACSPGWWDLTWAAVSAIALTVVAIGLLIGSLRGRAAQLIGPGIFLSLVTLALTITGINGTTGYGQQTWVPLSCRPGPARTCSTAGRARWT